MNSQIIGMLAESPVHPGAGRNEGVVDLPVAREAATDYPVIVGSSLKGALRERGREVWGREGQTKKVFGEQEQAGGLLVSDARLLLLPVRSLNSHYMWVTCPHLLERFARDRRRSGGEAALLSDAMKSALAESRYNALGPDSGEKLFLEERQFSTVATVDDAVVEALATLIAHQETARRLRKQLVVVRDDDFSWFARFGLAVNARNVLDEDTKKSENLWYEETIPADSLFYAVLAERDEGTLTDASDLFSEAPYLQVGGNATVGQGWFALEWKKKTGGSQ